MVDITLKVEALVNLSVTVVVSPITALYTVDKASVFAAISALSVQIDETDFAAAKHAVSSDASGEARGERATAPAGPAVLKVTLEREALISGSIAVIVLRVTALYSIKITSVFAAVGRFSVEIHSTIEATYEATETSVTARQRA